MAGDSSNPIHPPQNTQIPPVPNTLQPQVTQTPTPQPTAQTPQSNQQIITPEQNDIINPKSTRKNIILALLGLIILLVISSVTLIVLSTPTIEDLTECMYENEKNMEVIFQRGMTEKWNNQQKCVEIKPVSEKLISCYKRAGEKNLLPEQIAFTIGSLINSSVRNVDTESIISQHNSNCSQYPNTLIDY